MQRTDTIIIGAGQAGLALSHCLTEAGRDHVLFDRGRLAERWRSERWDTLRLLSPNWMTRLPGWRYTGNDPDGYMTAAELIRYFERYANSFDAPVFDDTTVESVRRINERYVVVTSRGTWSAPNVVVATGAEGYVRVPAAGALLRDAVAQLPSNRYHNPAHVSRGGVLVVGASATGIQLADELARSGREVVLAVGAHTRVPRQYRNRDIFWWLDRIGTFNTTIDEMPDPDAARRAPSLQLVGRPQHEQLDLGVLRDRGIELVGSLQATNGTRVRFADDLGEAVAASEQRMQRTLDQIDDYIESRKMLDVPAPERPAPLHFDDARTELDLRAAGIDTVLWATGFGRSYPWLHVPVLDADGEITHTKGVTDFPGLYVLGMRFQHHRNSNFIDGVGRDAAQIARHITSRCADPVEAVA
jgi:putative flavoprotein involved in K+ transport